MSPGVGLFQFKSTNSVKLKPRGFTASIYNVHLITFISDPRLDMYIQNLTCDLKIHGCICNLVEMQKIQTRILSLVMNETSPSTDLFTYMTQ